MLRKTIDILFRKNITRLGRWEHRNSAQINEIKLILANKDHCGDSICGIPKPINTILEETKVEKKNVSK